MTTDNGAVGKTGVFKAVAKVMAEIGPIAKERQNQEQHFFYRSVDQVWDALNPLLAKHKLVIVPVGFVDRREESWLTKRGNQAYRVAGQFKFRVYCGEDDSSFEGEVPAEAADYGDKALAKVCSMAYKQFCVQVFCIPLTAPDGDDESYERKGDQEASPPQAKPKPKAAASKPEKPVAEKPVAAKPVAAKPVATKPVAAPAAAGNGANAISEDKAYAAAVMHISNAATVDDVERLRARILNSPMFQADKKEELIGLLNSRSELISTG